MGNVVNITYTGSFLWYIEKFHYKNCLVNLELIFLTDVIVIGK